MCLLDLVEEHDGVGSPAHRLGELPALLVADVSRRRADQPGDRVLLHVLRHIEAHHGALVIKEELCERARQLRLAYAGGTEKDETPDWAVWIAQAGARPAHGVRNRGDRVILAHHALAQTVFHVDQLLDLALHHPRDGDAGPLAHHLGDILGVHFLFEHLPLALDLGEAGVLLLELLLQVEARAVAQLRGPLQVAGALRILLLDLRALDLLLQLADLQDLRLLVLPLRLHSGALLANLGELALDLFQALQAGWVTLLAKRLALDLELNPPPLQGVNLVRHGVDLHAQAACRLVDQVDCLVGQEAVRDIAVAERGRGDHRGVADSHAVVNLVALLQAAEDGDGVIDAGLAHEHRLEAPLQGGVLLDVLAILIERGRPDRAQLAACQHRLEHVCRVHGALRRARADDGVQLVDEEDDLPLRLGDLLEDGFQPVLELAAVLGAGDERAEVESHHALLPQALGHVAGDHALREALHDGRLADARLADQHRVVLGAPGEDLNHAPDLVIAADHWVQLSLAGEGSQVSPIPLERLILLLGVRIGHPMRATHRFHRLVDTVLAHPGLLQQSVRRIARVGDGEQQVLCRDIFVREALGLFPGLFQNAAEAGGDSLARRHAMHRRAALQVGLHRLDQRHAARAQLLQDRRHHALLLLQQRQQQVLDINLLLSELLGQPLRLLDRLLRLDRELIESHPSPPGVWAAPQTRWPARLLARCPASS